MEKIERKIKVDYFVPEYRGAGMARWATGIAGNIDAKKYAVSFVGLKIEESFESRISREVRVVDLGKLYAPGIFLKLVVYFRKERPDIFVSAFPHINVISVMAKIISGVSTKVILTEHNHFFLLASNASSAFRRFFGTRVLPGAMRLAYPLADAVICVSNGVAESILDVVNVKDKIRVIYNLVVSDDILRLAESPWITPGFQTALFPSLWRPGDWSDKKITLRCFWRLRQLRGKGLRAW